MTTDILTFLVRDKASMAGMSVPVSSGRTKKSWEQLQQEEAEADGETGGVQVVLMLRKGGQGKAGAKSISVASDSSLGEQFLAREAQELKERERVKQLTLEISERQEHEELTEALQQFGRVQHQPRHQHNRHNKGAPDADLIFGKKH